MAATGRGGRRPTITEQARRSQFIEVTIELVARRGSAGASLSQIAEAAGVSKAAVLYHFPTKNAVVEAAYESVIHALVEHVEAAVAAHEGASAVEAYIRSLVAYLRARPDHARMLIAGIIGRGDGPGEASSQSRWQPVAAFVDAAKTAGTYRAQVDSRATAVIVNGAIDGIVAQGLDDPDFDTAHAADELVKMLNEALR
ncbi:TetR/AcrR family transcriptional regulator [Glycomyces sp. NPDC046736]|uniref:TetR/AcrR family transcriptional regulator n=1 Tax=Glycomyces sp. NPDC046736 TaxID=3155615 RepID=UPI0033DEA108